MVKLLVRIVPVSSYGQVSYHCTTMKIVTYRQMLPNFRRHDPDLRNNHYFQTYVTYDKIMRKSDSSKMQVRMPTSRLKYFSWHRNLSNRKKSKKVIAVSARKRQVICPNIGPKERGNFFSMPTNFYCNNPLCCIKYVHNVRPECI